MRTAFFNPERPARGAAVRGIPLATLIAGALFLIGVGGCSRGPAALERAHVAGFVSIDGAPLKAGEIRFIPTANTKGPAAVAIISDGAYELVRNEGPVVGHHRIEIESANEEGDPDDEEFARRIAMGEDPIKRTPVPAAYNRDSILKAQVTSEGNLELDFPLNSAGNPPEE